MNQKILQVATTLSPNHSREIIQKKILTESAIFSCLIVWDLLVQVRFNTLKHAILGHLVRPPKAFANVLKAHFQLKREELARQVRLIIS